MSRFEGVRLAAVLLLGAALAFPVGLIVAGRDKAPRPPVSSSSAAMRNMFSPRVRSDPYFLDRQRENVEALEAYCRETRELCAEAHAARRRLDELAER